MAVLGKAESYPVEERRRGKLSRTPPHPPTPPTPPQTGRHGAGRSVSQSRTVWADWGIRPKVRKFVIASRFRMLNLKMKTSGLFATLARSWPYLSSLLFYFNFNVPGGALEI